MCANSQAAHDTCMKHDANIPSAWAERASGCDVVHIFRMCLLKTWSYFQSEQHRERYAHRVNLVKNVFFNCEESLIITLICVANKFTHFINKKSKVTLSKLRTSANQ